MYDKALQCHNESIKYDEFRLRAWRNKENVLQLMIQSEEAEECKKQILKIFQT